MTPGSARGLEKTPEQGVQGPWLIGGAEEEGTMRSRSAATSFTTLMCLKVWAHRWGGHRKARDGLDSTFRERSISTVTTLSFSF
jgi:hypothetical protein